MTVYDHIVHMISVHSTVLDLGCETGELLARLRDERSVHGRGIDIDAQSIQECIRKGISVLHSNLNEGLKRYPDKSYDYVVLSRTLQQVDNPRDLLDDMVRVGRKCIVNFPNFAHILNRIQLSLGGRMPVNHNLPYEWYNTPNIHFFTLKDFTNLCTELHITIEHMIYLQKNRTISRMFPNLFATEVCALLFRV